VWQGAAAVDCQHTQHDAAAAAGQGALMWLGCVFGEPQKHLQHVLQ
jgi:hypothetical protein